MQMATALGTLLRGEQSLLHTHCSGGSKGGQLNRSLCSSHLLRLPENRPVLCMKEAGPAGHPDPQSSQALGSNAQHRVAARIWTLLPTAYCTMCGHCWLNQEQ